MSIRSIIYGSLFVLFLTGCEDKQAAEIKAETETDLAAMVAAGELSHGAVAVEPEGDGYRVAIADTVFKPAPDMEFHAGTLRYIHIPVDDELVRYEDARIDSPVAIRKADGTDTGSMEIDIERAEGTWLKPLQAFVSIDVLLSAVQIESPDDPTVQLDNARISIETDDSRAERTDQTGTLSVESMRFLEETGARTELEGLRLESELSAVDLAAWTAASSALDKAAASGGDIAGAIVQMIDSIGAARGSLVLDRLTHADGTGTEEFSLTGTHLTFGVADVDQETGSLQLALGYETLDLAEDAFADDPTAELMAPLSMNLNVAFSNVPFRQVASTMTAMAPNLTQAGEGQADIVALLILSALQTALSNAETQVDLSGTEFVLRDARVNLDGTVDIDPGSMFGAIADLDLAIRGLDALTAKAMALPRGPEAEQLQQSLMYLASVSERDADGSETVDRYKILLTPAGDILVNGQPVF